jgi:hypothetical protein
MWSFVVAFTLLPRIQDILAKRTGYAFFTTLDISMQL